MVPRLCLAPFAALLSFAHGANAVSNAAGPLYGVVSALRTGAAGGGTAIPLWVMVIGAFGISLGLLLFGPRLIRIVGNESTKFNLMRGFCVALSSAVNRGETLTVNNINDYGADVAVKVAVK